MAAKAGTKENPWKLKTPLGTSEFEVYKDEASDPAALVVQVGYPPSCAIVCSASKICTPC
jgi:hypothetical protein